MRLIKLAMLASVLVSGHDLARAQQSAPARPVLLDNAVAMVAKLHLPAGWRQTDQKPPGAALLIQITPGDVEMTIGGKKMGGQRVAGQTWFVPGGLTYAAANLGSSATEIVAIHMKAPPRPESSAPTPATPVPAGINRAPVLENDATRVVRVVFALGAREEVHSHPFDLLVVQLTAGRVETLLGPDKTVVDLAPGQVIFLPRDIPHAVANAGARSFDIMSVAIK